MSDLLVGVVRTTPDTLCVGSVSYLATEVSGSLNGDDLEVAVVLSEFNDFVTNELARGAREGFQQCGVSGDNLTLYRVPGAYEIPGTAHQVYQRQDPDGILCLGAVIRGDTPHFDYICSHVSRGVGRLSYEADVPVSFGVLTTDTVQQAIERAGTKSGNKGHEAALSLVRTINTYREI